MIELLCTDYNKKASFIHYNLNSAVLGISVKFFEKGVDTAPEILYNVSRRWWLGRTGRFPAGALGSASVAQSVEQGTENPRVGGSIPPLGTINMAV